MRDINFLFLFSILLIPSCSYYQTCDNIPNEWKTEKSAIKWLNKTIWDKTETINIRIGDIYRIEYNQCLNGRSCLIIDGKDGFGLNKFIGVDSEVYRSYFLDVPIHLWDDLKTSGDFKLFIETKLENNYLVKIKTNPIFNRTVGKIVLTSSIIVVILSILYGLFTKEKGNIMPPIWSFILILLFLGIVAQIILSILGY